MIATMSKDGFLTVDEAAALLQMHPVTLRNHLRKGTIPGRKIGGEWRLSRAALEKYLSGEDLKLKVEQE